MKRDVKIDWTELVVMIVLIMILSMPFAADAAGGAPGSSTGLRLPPASNDWRA